MKLDAELQRTETGCAQDSGGCRRYIHSMRTQTFCDGRSVTSSPAGASWQVERASTRNRRTASCPKSIGTRTIGTPNTRSISHRRGEKRRLEATRLAGVVECCELPEGLIMWEDEVLCHGERAGWTDEWYGKAKWLIDQLTYSRDHRP